MSHTGEFTFIYFYDSMSDERCLEYGGRTMKRFLITFIIAFMSIALIFTGVKLFEHVETTGKERDLYKAKVSDLEKKYTELQDILTVITPETFQEKVANKEKMYVYIGRPDCGDCAALDPQLVQYIKEHPALKKKLLFVNVRLIREDAAKWAQFQHDFSVIGTPHFAQWEDGLQVSKSEWTKESGYSIDMFDAWAKKQQLTV